MAVKITYSLWFYLASKAFKQVGEQQGRRSEQSDRHPVNHLFRLFHQIGVPISQAGQVSALHVLAKQNNVYGMERLVRTVGWQEGPTSTQAMLMRQMEVHSRLGETNACSRVFVELQALEGFRITSLHFRLLIDSIQSPENLPRADGFLRGVFLVRIFPGTLGDDKAGLVAA